MNLFAVISIIIASLYVIYDTDAIPFYLKSISNKIFKVTDYFKFRQTFPVQISYLEYICQQSNADGKYGFWINLLVCSNCVAVWLSLLSIFLCNLSLELVGIEVILVWIGYATLRKVLKKLYE